jgi:hypothetical protein
VLWSQGKHPPSSSTFFTYDVNNLINGSGLVGNLHDNDWEHMWITDGTPTGWLIFDLGAVYSLGYASVSWPWHASCANALNCFGAQG